MTREAVTQVGSEIVSFIASDWRQSDRDSMAASFKPVLQVGGIYYFFGNGHYQKSVPSANTTGNNGATLMNNNHVNDESVIAASPDAEQNADEAAEYWAQL